MHRRSTALVLATSMVAAACGGGDESNLAVEVSQLPTVPEAHPPKASPPAHVVGGFSIELPPRTLAPGEERFPCVVFPLEITGASRIVGGGRMVAQPGMHHGNITTRPVTGEGIRSCGDEETGALGGSAEDVLAGGSVLFGSSTQLVGEEWQSFPDGAGFPIADGYEIVARMHYVNATLEPLTVAPTYEWYTIDEAKVTTVLGPFAWVLSGWEIPPLAELTVEAECRPPGEMNIVSALPHMHALGTGFTAGWSGGDLDGELFLDSVGYDPDRGVMTQFTPAARVQVGEAVRFGCSWRNTFDKPIVEGVGDNEMCILFGYAYPYEHAYTAQASANGCVMIASPRPGS